MRTPVIDPRHDLPRLTNCIVCSGRTRRGYLLGDVAMGVCDVPCWAETVRRIRAGDVPVWAEGLTEQRQAG